MLLNNKNEKLMGNSRKLINYEDIRAGGGCYNYMHDKLVYEFYYPDDTIEQLTNNIISENMPSQVDSEGHHYQVLTEVTYHKRY